MKHSSTPTLGSRHAAQFLALLALLGVSPTSHAQDENLVAIRDNMPRVVLNQIIYEDSAAVTATVTFVDAADVKDAAPALIFATASSGDVEPVDLKPTANPRVFTTSQPLIIRDSAASVTPGNGSIELAPGEIFSALLAYQLSNRTQKPGDRTWAGDWGTLADPGSTAAVEVRPGLALTEDELNPPIGLPPVGTLFFEGEPGPVQVASEHLMFLPESNAQLSQFLSRTGGQVAFVEGRDKPVTSLQELPEAGTAWLLVKVSGDPSKIHHLPQLRALAGATKTLVSSNEATLALVATAMELWADGFLVGLEPRMQLHGDLYWPEHVVNGTRLDSYGSINPNNANVLRDENFGIRQSWAFLAMFDYDRARIPVGVIDSGFAPNPDFRTGDPLYSERNLSNGTSGIGSTRVPQEVGNSFFGDKTWHGNGTVTTIAGIGGNNFGSAGVAAQVAVPKLYHMGLANFAFGFGTAIRLAVDDGCSVINISAGYPCRILSVLGNDNIASPEGRAAFALKLGLAVRGAAAAACAAAPLLDAFLPGLGAVTCSTAIAAAEAAALALFSTVFIGETRTPVERAVEYATSRGVPIVASAGNRMSAAALGALAPFVDIANTNISDWQVIPAVIPDVIAVGCCASGGWSVWDGDGNNHYANIHFWGDEVDIWAPFGNWYWAPENGTANPASVPAAEHIQRTFSATSNAAPIITGVICNLMAIDPSLDPRTAPPASRSGLAARIRNILVETAHQAGSPAAPNSADAVATLVVDPETGEWTEIDEPAELVTQMQRRRNYVNAWAAVRKVAADAGLPDYSALGYTSDYGRSDAFADVAAPDGVLLPLAPSSFPVTDELSANDREFWFIQTPSNNQIFTVRYDITIPTREDATSLLINGRPGTFISGTGVEQTLAWETPPLWRNTHYPISISSRWGMDTLYKLNSTRTTQPAPSPDAYDLGSLSNETLDEAPAISDWFIAPAHGLLEVKAHELNINSLNFHSPTDVDVFCIEFPAPPLGLPSSCGSLSPWITIHISPPDSNLRLQVFSRADGSDRLIARANGADAIRLDCRDYLGRLPLYVMIDNPSGTFAEYVLNVRFSEPDAKLGARLDRIREAHAGPREIPFFERFFRPEIPWLRGSPGLLPDPLVNPNPSFAQQLDADGRFLASRLFFVEVAKGSNFNIGFLTTFGDGQSLRMELLTIDEQILGLTSTQDLGQFANKDAPLVGPTQSLGLSFQSLPEGVYILRLSGHRPGDPIALYLSESLNPPGGFSIEDLYNQQGQGKPTLLSQPPELLAGTLAATAVRPTLNPEDLVITQARELAFLAHSNVPYQVETLDESAVWQPYGNPIVTEKEETISVVVPGSSPSDHFRIAKLADTSHFPPDWIGPAYHLQFQSRLSTPYILTGSATLEADTFKPFGESPAFVGDGSLNEWLFAPQQVPPPPFFFRIEK